MKFKKKALIETPLPLLGFITTLCLKWAIRLLPFFQENPRKRNITTTNACPLGLGLSFQQLRTTAGCLFECKIEERKSPMLSTLDLLILYKFSPPDLGAAVSSCVYLHSNNIMKTQSGFKNPPSQDITKLNPSWRFFCVQWRHFSLSLGDTTDFPSRTFDSWFFRLELNVL